MISLWDWHEKDSYKNSVRIHQMGAEISNDFNGSKMVCAIQRLYRLKSQEMISPCLSIYYSQIV